MVVNCGLSVVSRHNLGGGWRNPPARPASNPTILGNFMVGALARNLIKFEMYFSKMFVGGLSWQTTEGIYRTNKNQSALLASHQVSMSTWNKRQYSFFKFAKFSILFTILIVYENEKILL